MLLALAFICLFGATYLVAEVVSVGARQRSLALRRATTYSRARIATGPERMKFRERVVMPLVERLARLTLRLTPPSRMGSSSGNSVMFNLDW